MLKHLQGFTTAFLFLWLCNPALMRIACLRLIIPLTHGGVLPFLSMVLVNEAGLDITFECVYL